MLYPGEWGWHHTLPAQHLQEAAPPPCSEPLARHLQALVLTVLPPSEDPKETSPDQGPCLSTLFMSLLPHCEVGVKSGSLFYGIQGHPRPGEVGEEGGLRQVTSGEGPQPVVLIESPGSNLLWTGHRHEGEHLHRHLGDSVQDTYSKCSINAGGTWPSAM